MDELNNYILQEMMRRSMPDLSHIRPPTESAAETMIKNLKAAAGTKVDHSPENTEWQIRFFKGFHL